MDLGDATAAGVLARAEQALLDRRQAVLDDLEACLAWVDLHPVVPAGPRWPADGGPKLVQPGGAGTPEVVDTALVELAVARQTSTVATRAAVADAVDLRHRLPRCWIAVRDLACEAWVARKIAARTRHLTTAAALLVDAAVGPALTTQSPGRVLELAETALIHADPLGHLDRLETRRRTRTVHLGRTDPDTGLRTLFARLDASDATWIQATLETVTDLLLAHPDLRRRHHPDLPHDPTQLTRDEVRAVALGWLARPHDLADLLDHLHGRRSSRASASEPESRPDQEPTTSSEDAAEHDTQTPEVPVRPCPGRGAQVYIHLDPDALTSPLGVATAEGIGAMIRSELLTLLAHTAVTLTPVIDLATTSAISGYTHSDVMTERAWLRCRGEAFPHTTSRTRRLDDDHPTPYHPHGPPGQTGDHNLARLTRTTHRAKTHHGYTVHQLDHTTWLWRTPHGLWRLVDHTGTHTLTPSEATMLLHRDALTRAHARLHATDTAS